MKGFLSIRRFFKKSFSRRLVLYLSGMMLLTFCLSGYISYKVHLRLYTSELGKQFLKANEQAASRLDLQIRDIYRISNSIVFNANVQKLLDRSTLTEEKYTQISDQDELNELLNQIKVDEPKLYSMYLFDLKHNGFVLSNPLGGFAPLDESTYQLVRERLDRTLGELVWFPLRMPSLLEDTGFREVIAAARTMKTKDFRQYGIMDMLFDQSLFVGDLRGIIENDKANVYLYDKQDRLVYSDMPESETIPLTLPSHTETTVVQDGETYLYVKSRSGQTDFKLISRVSLKEMEKRSAVIFQIAVVLGLVSILLGAIMVAVTGNRLLAPLKQLIAGMRRVKEGDFKAQIAIRTEDELAYIGQMFNGMAANIDSLIKEVYIRQLSEREAELTALQAQLNPHFMYNTLDSIYWKLYLKKDRETAKLVISLSGLLRYALEPASTKTTLGEEIRQIRSYLTIQLERFGSGLDTIIQVDKELESCAMARMLLQPIVENVFVHAFADKLSGKVLWIKAYKAALYPPGSPDAEVGTGTVPGAAQAQPGASAKEVDAGFGIGGLPGGRRSARNMLVIEVIDNGCGINESKLRQIMDAATEYTSNAEQPHIGMRNVIRRVDLIYGSPYGVSIHSEPGRGTSVSLKLPYEQQAAEQRRGRYER